LNLDKGDYRSLPEIDWETNCIKSLVGYILNSDYMKENYEVILARTLAQLNYIRDYKRRNKID
jgi:hypothetical protein